jgi:hypothetical protein
MRHALGVSTFLFAALVSTSSIGAGCVSTLKVEKGAIDKIIKCLSEIEIENDDLRKQVADLQTKAPVPGPEGKQGAAGEKGEKGDPGNPSEFPRNVVVASLSECAQLGKDWTPWREGTGRFLIGAGKDTVETYGTWTMQLAGGNVRVRPLTTYSALATGGEEQHQLSIAEMPAHTHRLYRTKGMTKGNAVYPDWSVMGEDLKQDVADTLPSGGGLPHNTLPPFIALYYCKKG